jgi:lariat debranching enzyme
VRKLLQIRTQVDIGISHDWPRAVERHGNEKALYRSKPDFEAESRDGTLGSTAAKYVMDKLRPPYWFAAHMHVRFSALVDFGKGNPSNDSTRPTQNCPSSGTIDGKVDVARNADEIDIDVDSDDAAQAVAGDPEPAAAQSDTSIDKTNVVDLKSASKSHNQRATDNIPLVSSQEVSADLRSQLPASFARPQPRALPELTPPAAIKNSVTRFLALDKCLPGRKFLQILDDVKAASDRASSPSERPGRFRLEYDKEWLAITRVFASELILGDRTASNPPPKSESVYRRLIEEEEQWVEEHVIKVDKMTVPENFVQTAPVYDASVGPIVSEEPEEYNNPQTAAFCALIGIDNQFFSSDEEKAERVRRGVAPENQRMSTRGHGGYRGRGSGGGRGRGRDKGRGRGRGWR